MAIPSPDARLLTDEVLDAVRWRALRGCALGFTETELESNLRRFFANEVRTLEPGPHFPWDPHPAAQGSDRP
jgi:hypothetical protein